MSDFGAMEAGLAFAGMGYLLDEQAERLLEQQRETHVHVHIEREAEPEPVLINAAEGSSFSADWDSFIGQKKLKEQLRVHIASAKARNAALPHTLLASGQPGAGKTHMARLIAAEMGGKFIMLVPPFHVSTLHQAVQQLPDQGLIFLDEVHKMADNGARGAEVMLHLLEEKRLYLDSGVVQLDDITVIGATTDPDKLPETIVDRFPIKPHFARYSITNMRLITATFEGSMGLVDDDGLPQMTHATRVTIAKASRRVPRIARELVVAARDLAIASGRHLREITGEELLAFKELDKDGMAPIHRAYLTGLYRYFARPTDDGVIYVAGEMSMVSMLRETRQGIGRIERYLLERGMIDRTAQGRRLTEKGIRRAQRSLEKWGYQ